jgi:hypothetical protein
MITLLEAFHWSQLLQPQYYIENGGLWLLLFVVFAETGLFFGFFLPGDSLLFVAGIYSAPLAAQIFAIFLCITRFVNSPEPVLKAGTPISSKISTEAGQKGVQRY